MEGWKGISRSHFAGSWVIGMTRASPILNEVNGSALRRTADR